MSTQPARGHARMLPRAHILAHYTHCAIAASCGLRTCWYAVLKGASAIKLFGWEQRIMDEVMEKRKTELTMVMRTQLCGAASQFLTLSVPAVVSVATFTVFTKVQKGDLDAARAFTSLALFGLLAQALSQIPNVIQVTIINFLIQSSFRTKLWTLELLPLPLP